MNLVASQARLCGLPFRDEGYGEQLLIHSSTS